MAYYTTTLQKGSTGVETKKWQEFLQSKGYDLEIDGIFGDETEKYTKDYQRNHRDLDADGIVGEKTWTRAGFTDGNEAISAPTASPLPEAPEYSNTMWDSTDKGEEALDDYNDAKAAVNSYGDFKYANQEQLDAIMNSILNREQFSYNFNEDAFYQMYKDKFMKQGKMASADVMGQAAAMTGGYGNSYAATVGNQAYQASLEQLNDVIPELYQMAYDRYNQEGQDLYNKYGLLNSDYERAYGQHQDEYNKLMDSLGIAKSDYYDGADMHYTEQSNKNSIASQQFNDAMSIWQSESDNAWKQAQWDEEARRYATELAYQQERDFVADQQWQKDYDAVYGSKSTGGSGGSGGSGGGSGSSGGGSYDNGSLDAEKIKALQKALGVTADGKYGANTKQAAGGLSADEAYKKYVLGQKPQPKTSTNLMDFNRDQYSKNVKEKGGSFYADALADLKAMKKAGKDNKSAQSYLSELVANSLLTGTEYSRLYNLYRDNKL